MKKRHKGKEEMHTGAAGECVQCSVIGDVLGAVW